MAEARRWHPGDAAGLCREGEARPGLEPAARRVWALNGTRPTSCGRHRFEPLFVYGFAHPGTGRSRLAGE